MWPTLYTQKTALGEVPYNSWGLMITLAFLASAIVAHRRVARVGIDPDGMVGMYLLAIFGGLVGARLLHFLMATPAQFFADPLLFFNLGRGGFAFYGGFILAGGLCIAYAVRRKMDPWKLADALAPTVMLGLAIGRIGCFLAGCCHGRKFVLPPDAHGILPDTFTGGQIFVFSEWPFAAEMMRHGVGVNDIPVLPTQPYETIAAFTIFLITSLLFRVRKFDGMVFAAVLILYGIWRPFNESLRGDEIRGTGYFGALTTSQVIAIPTFLLGVAIVVLKFRGGVKPETAVKRDDPQKDEPDEPESVPRI